MTQDSRHSPTRQPPEDEPKPFLRIVKGNPTPEELAALVTVLAAAGTEGTPAPRRTAVWSAHHRKVRVTIPHGPAGWRSSSLPR